MPYDQTPDETDNDPKTKYEDMSIHPHPSMLPLDRAPKDQFLDDNKPSKKDTESGR